MRHKIVLLLIGALVLGISPVHAILGIGEPPITVNVRPSAIGAGYVLIITNTSDDPLHQISVKAKNPSGEELKRKIVTVTLDAHKSVEVGWMEVGWKFDPGEKVYVGAKGYWSDVSGTVPK